MLTELYQNGINTLSHLARVVHSSVPSVTAMMDELAQAGWVAATGTATGNFGRRPMLYGLNADRFRVLIFDITTHDTSLLVLSLNREVLFQRDFGIPLTDSPGFVPLLLELADHALSEWGILPEALMAVGLSMPGLIDYRRGLNVTYPNLNGSGLQKHLQQHFGTPAFLINDTKATILGEHRFGLAKGHQFVLSINIDWGVGLGVILNGEVFQGASGYASELGHIQVDPDGELCHCGKVGCLDTVASASALLRKVQKGLDEKRTSVLAGQQQLTIEVFLEAIQNGDAFAIDVMYEIGTALGKGLVVAVQLFNPEMIIIDGLLAQAGTFITSPLVHALNKYCLTDFRTDLIVERSQLGQKARYMGTHVHVIEQMLLKL